MKQSVSSKIVGALLRAVFHSQLVKNTTFSEDKNRIIARPKDSDMMDPPAEMAKAEAPIPTERNCDKVILTLHGGSFKEKLLDLYRRPAEKYSFWIIALW